MTVHTAAPPVPLTAAWLGEEIRRHGLHETLKPPCWGGEEDVILAALQHGPPDADALSYDQLRRAVITALWRHQRGDLVEARNLLADAIKGSVGRDRKTENGWLSLCDPDAPSDVAPAGRADLGNVR
ncbi:hypothetical protein E2C06_33615 [Dankookia rubra]|uniref:Uncharacterized protein n=1 Tax=Dankookia rubra TaxID=1442381 RepID=A0A4R5Q5U9_9PROT|nr:hypothetical protein [Dankookia rubra]TDH58254.1 hypothetical protein E2C06_33615 [Dankookia rubra]